MVAVTERVRRKIRRAEYDRMVEVGLFQHERLELIRGELVAMSPIGVKHATVVTELDRRLHRACPAGLVVRCQQPLICADDSEPEPDLAVVPFDPAPTTHPTRALLVIEVADRSRDADLTDKAALYAESDVDEYWVLDLDAGCVHVHRDRADGGWRSIAVHGADLRLTPAALPDLAVALADVRTPTR
jgi:Uma2 family endonuclease